MNPTPKQHQSGQPVWLEGLNRQMLDTGELDDLAHAAGISGITACPLRMEHAIHEGAYDEVLTDLMLNGEPGRPEDLCEQLSDLDTRNAADTLYPIYEASGGETGFVTVQIPALAAHSLDASLEHARRRWQAIDRPNVMIEIPATRSGVFIIEQLLLEGISVCASQICSVERYWEVAEATVRALCERVANNQPVDMINSVASFALAPVDFCINHHIDQQANPDNQLEMLRDQIGSANALAALSVFHKTFFTEVFNELVEVGAHPQRILWTETDGNSDYTALFLGSEAFFQTNTSGFHAWVDAGSPQATDADIETGLSALQMLDQSGIDLRAATAQIEAQLIAALIKDHEALQEAVAERMTHIMEEQAIQTA